MANKRVDKSTRALVLAALCEGTAINSICRMFGVGKHAVLRIIEETGEACEDWHDRHFRNLTVHRLELDEQWSYVHTHKERMSKEQQMEHPDRGDCWLWAGIDADSKAIIGWRTADRSGKSAREFCMDLAGRIASRVQITSDQHAGYGWLSVAFQDADIAQESKVFSNSRALPHEWMIKRVEPLTAATRKTVAGAPNLATATVCHVERFFLTMRQGNKRCARKTLAYSKKWENHGAMASVLIFAYNLSRKHETTKVTPAMALGVTDHRWSLEEVVAMVDAYQKAKQEAAFEDAFAGFTMQPSSGRVHQPQKPLTPWYHDPESGGPNPAIRKPGIRYDD